MLTCKFESANIKLLKDII